MHEYRFESILDFICSVCLGRRPSQAETDAAANVSNDVDVVTTTMLAPEFSSATCVAMRETTSLNEIEADFARSHFPKSKALDLQRLTRAEFIETVLDDWLLEQFDAEGVSIIEMKSLPRSGHHYLVELLERYFDKELRYCERYEPEDCCHRLPCLKPHREGRTNHYMLQKSHDFQLADRKRPSGRYIIQHRAIVERAQSDFELAIVGRSRSDTVADFRKFCIAATYIQINFYKKWLLDASINKCVIDYRDLVRDPLQALDSAVSFISSAQRDHPRDDAERHNQRLASAVGAITSKLNPVNSPETIRDPTQFRYFDAGLYREMEQMIRDSCPEIDVAYYFT